MTEPTPRDRLADELEVWSNKPSNDRDAHRVLAAAILEAVRDDRNRPRSHQDEMRVSNVERLIAQVNALAEERDRLKAERESGNGRLNDLDRLKTSTPPEGHESEDSCSAPSEGSQPSGAGGFTVEPGRDPTRCWCGRHELRETDHAVMWYGEKHRYCECDPPPLGTVDGLIAARDEIRQEGSKAKRDLGDAKRQIASLESSLREATENFHAAEQTVRSIAALLGWQSPPTRETLENEIRALKERVAKP